jgi:hypothetical protein
MRIAQVTTGCFIVLQIGVTLFETTFKIQRRNVLAERTKYSLRAPTCVNVTGTDPENGFVTENSKDRVASKTYRGCPLNITLIAMYYQQYGSV